MHIGNWKVKGDKSLLRCEIPKFIVENSIKTYTEKLPNVLTALESSSGGLFQHQAENKVRVLNYWQLQPTEL